MRELGLGKLPTCWVHFATAYMAGQPRLAGNASRYSTFKVEIVKRERDFDCHWESDELKTMKMCLVIQTIPFAIWENDTKIQQHHAVTDHESSFYRNRLVNIKLNSA